MNIKEMLSTNANVQVVVNVADLKEFALSLIDVFKKEPQTYENQGFVAIGVTGFEPVTDIDKP